MPRTLRLVFTGALLAGGCAAAFTSTVVLKERNAEGGTVRVVCPSYPPDADTQAKVSAEMVNVCAPREWKVVDVKLQDVRGPSGIACVPGVPCQPAPGPWQQQIDFTFSCIGSAR